MWLASRSTEYPARENESKGYWKGHDDKRCGHKLKERQQGGKEENRQTLDRPKETRERSTARERESAPQTVLVMSCAVLLAAT